MLPIFHGQYDDSSDTQHNSANKTERRKKHHGGWVFDDVDRYEPPAGWSPIFKQIMHRWNDSDDEEIDSFDLASSAVSEQTTRLSENTDRSVQSNSTSPSPRADDEVQDSLSHAKLQSASWKDNSKSSTYPVSLPDSREDMNIGMSVHAGNTPKDATEPTRSFSATPAMAGLSLDVVPNVPISIAANPFLSPTSLLSPTNDPPNGAISSVSTVPHASPGILSPSSALNKPPLLHSNSMRFSIPAHPGRHTDMYLSRFVARVASNEVHTQLPYSPMGSPGAQFERATSAVPSASPGGPVAAQPFSPIGGSNSSNGYYGNGGGTDSGSNQAHSQTATHGQTSADAQARYHHSQQHTQHHPFLPRPAQHQYHHPHHHPFSPQPQRSPPSSSPTNANAYAHPSTLANPHISAPVLPGSASTGAAGAVVAVCGRGSGVSQWMMPDSTMSMTAAMSSAVEIPNGLHSHKHASADGPPAAATSTTTHTASAVSTQRASTAAITDEDDNALSSTDADDDALGSAVQTAAGGATAAAVDSVEGASGMGLGVSVSISPLSPLSPITPAHTHTHAHAQAHGGVHTQTQNVVRDVVITSGITATQNTYLPSSNDATGATAAVAENAGAPLPAPPAAGAGSAVLRPSIFSAMSPITGVGAIGALATKSNGNTSANGALSGADDPSGYVAVDNNTSGPAGVVTDVSTGVSNSTGTISGDNSAFNAGVNLPQTASLSVNPYARPLSTAATPLGSAGGPSSMANGSGLASGNSTPYTGGVKGPRATVASLLVMPADYEGPRSITIGKPNFTPGIRGISSGFGNSGFVSSGFGGNPAFASRVSASLFAPAPYSRVSTTAPAPVHTHTHTHAHGHTHGHVHVLGDGQARVGGVVARAFDSASTSAPASAPGSAVLAHSAAPSQHVSSDATTTTAAATGHAIASIPVVVASSLGTTGTNDTNGMTLSSGADHNTAAHQLPTVSMLTGLPASTAATVPTVVVESKPVMLLPEAANHGPDGVSPPATTAATVSTQSTALREAGSNGNYGEPVDVNARAIEEEDVNDCDECLRHDPIIRTHDTSPSSPPSVSLSAGVGIAIAPVCSSTVSSALFAPQAYASVARRSFVAIEGKSLLHREMAEDQ